MSKPLSDMTCLPFLSPLWLHVRCSTCNSLCRGSCITCLPFLLTCIYIQNIHMVFCFYNLRCRGGHITCLLSPFAGTSIPNIYKPFHFYNSLCKWGYVTCLSLPFAWNSIINIYKRFDFCNSLCRRGHMTYLPFLFTIMTTHKTFHLQLTLQRRLHNLSTIYIVYTCLLNIHMMFSLP